MLTVIFGHAAVYGQEIFFKAGLIAVYEFHMPFFFVMAGFLLNFAKWGGTENFRPFVTKLFQRLLVPYYLAEILWYPIWFFAGHVMGHTAYIRNPALSPENAFWGIFVGNGNLLALVPLWFLPALFIAEIIFLQLHNRFAKLGDKIFVPIIVALSCSGYLIGQKIFLPMSFDVALTVQIFILAGVLIRKYNLVEKITLRRAFILLNIFALIFLLNGKISIASRDYGDLFFLCAGGIAGTLLVMKFSVLVTKVGGKICALIKYCGRQSLLVMTLHLPVAFVIYDIASTKLNLPVETVRALPEIIFAITLFGTLIPLWIAKRFGKLPVVKNFCA